jgi:predicted DNA-binding protein
MSNTEPLFPEKLVLRVPEGFSELLDAVARRDHRTRSEYVRQVLLTQLRADNSEGAP